MNIEKAKALIESELKACAALFEGTGVLTDYCVEDTKNDTPDGEETVDLFGVISLRAEGADDSGALFVPLNTELDSYGEVKDDLLAESITKFREKLERYRELIAASPDVSATIKELNREIDDELEREYRERLARLDAATKKNLKIAICATVALLAVAAVCFFIKGLLG